MKIKWKELIAGIMIGAIITGGFGLAANAATLYDVIDHGIRIVVDGKKLNPTDANGNAVEPIIYNGTTYLPVRAVANALGKAVYWDGPEYTVYLGNMNGKLEYPTVELEKMTSIGTSPSKAGNNRLTDNYGNRYSRAIWCSTGDKQYEYLLNMKYSRLKGVFYVPEGETSSHSICLKVIADGKTIYTSPEITKSSAPVQFDVNVRGYNDVVIDVSYSGFYGIEACIAEAGFYQ